MSLHIFCLDDGRSSSICARTEFQRTRMAPSSVPVRRQHVSRAPSSSCYSCQIENQEVVGTYNCKLDDPRDCGVPHFNGRVYLRTQAPVHLSITGRRLEREESSQGRSKAATTAGPLSRTEIYWHHIRNALPARPLFQTTLKHCIGYA